ncbi:hypothetical protein WJX75_006551 [Coccomyxa subellipsoidea]|uniref:peptidylprolyl isomerase n=1 Tax=Coccomyxa subellipsoidea TaxID=248742 RepID=A0ABR2YPU1_9CHLO
MDRSAQTWLLLLIMIVWINARGILRKELRFKKELKKRKADLSEYETSSDGLRFIDLSVGSGDEVSKGQRVTVHFDCIYKGINVVSSRQARLLGGNRTISERSVIVPPELGYGKTGLQEIPPNAPFEMRIEVLQVG